MFKLFFENERKINWHNTVCNIDILIPPMGVVTKKRTVNMKIYIPEKNSGYHSLGNVLSLLIF